MWSFTLAASQSASRGKARAPFLMLLLDFNTPRKEGEKKEESRIWMLLFWWSPWRHIHLMGKQRWLHRRSFIETSQSQVQFSALSGSFLWGNVMICISFSCKCDRREGAVRKTKMSKLTNYNWGRMNFCYFRKLSWLFPFFSFLFLDLRFIITVPKPHSKK